MLLKSLKRSRARALTVSLEIEKDLTLNHPIFFDQFAKLTVPKSKSMVEVSDRLLLKALKLMVLLL